MSVLFSLLAHLVRITNCLFGFHHRQEVVKAFHQWAIGWITIVLPHSAIESDLTDLYLTKDIFMRQLLLQQPLIRPIELKC